MLESSKALELALGATDEERALVYGSVASGIHAVNVSTNDIQRLAKPHRHDSRTSDVAKFPFADRFNSVFANSQIRDG